MKTLSLCLLFCCTLSVSAQTKKIAHRSHSGSNSTFSLKAIDNLGVAPTQRITQANLDTLKILPDHRIVMVTSEVCHEENWNGRVVSDTSLWKAGTDTLEKHPLFSKQHELDHIKKVLKKDYNFQNDIDEVKFIGYDNRKTKKKKSKVDRTDSGNHEEISPASPDKTIDKEDSQIDHSMLWFLITIPLISVGIWSKVSKD